MVGKPVDFGTIVVIDDPQAVVRDAAEQMDRQHDFRLTPQHVSG